MTCLKCSVDNCVNNCDHRCCLQGIEVCGPESENRYDTCCASFVSRSDAASNSISQTDDPSTESEIRCTAEKCVHHCDGDRCDANCVCVGTYSHDSCCMEETQCETFAQHKLENIHDE